MSKGQLITIQPDGRHTEQRFETATKVAGPGLGALQAAVGGYIERVRVRLNGRVRDAYVNEDGISQRLPFNRPGTALLAPPFIGSQLFGNVAVWIPDPKTTRQLDADAEVDI